MALVGVAAWLVPGVVARAATGGYPQASMPCEWAPQAHSGPAGTEWCQDFDWGPTPSTVVDGVETVDEPSTISPRGFGYRNCTDYVAYKLGFTAATIHGNAAQWRDQVPADHITQKPAVGAVAWWGTEVDGGFGHVGVVLSVNANGSAVVGEYNARLDGTYDSRTIPITGRGAADAYLHIRDEGLPGGVPYTPPFAVPSVVVPSPAAAAASPAPHPSPATQPSPTARAGLDTPRLLAAVLDNLTPASVRFTPPGVVRPGVSQLVEVRIPRPDRVLSAMDQELTATGTGTVTPGDAVGATLTATDASVVATTPPQQPLTGPGDAVWQWRLTGLRDGSSSLTLCFSVAILGAHGPLGTPSRCFPEQTIRVTALPAVLARGWPGRHLGLLAVGMAVALLAGADLGMRLLWRAHPAG